MKTIEEMWIISILIFKTCCAFGRISNTIPPDYDMHECPPGYQGHPAILYLILSILDIDRIDEGRMEFSVQAYLEERWTDWRLNLSSYVGENAVAFPQTLVQHLWVPDLVFDNAKSGVLFDVSVPNTFVVVYEDLSLARTSRYNLVISCQMNFLYYPMDTQFCFIKLALLSNPDNKVTLRWGGQKDTDEEGFTAIRFASEVQALKYRIEPPKTYKTQELWPTGNYSFLYANFTFVRLISGSILNTYVPSTLIVCFSWLSFWLEVTAVPARVTLGATSLLTLVTQMFQARQGLPPISYMTAMDVWLFSCLLTVFGSLLAFAFAYHVNVLHKKNAAQSADHQTVNSDATGSNCNLRIRRSTRLSMYQSNKTASKILKVETTAQSAWEQVKDAPLDKYFQIAFPLTFTTFALIYWSCYLSYT